MRDLISLRTEKLHERKMDCGFIACLINDNSARRRANRSATFQCRNPIRAERSAEAASCADCWYRQRHPDLDVKGRKGPGDTGGSRQGGHELRYLEDWRSCGCAGQGRDADRAMKASSKGDELRKRVDTEVYAPASGSQGFGAVHETEIVATVQSINSKNKTITLRGPWRTETFDLSSEIAAYKLKPGDTVHAVLISATAVEVTPTAK